MFFWFIDGYGNFFINIFTEFGKSLLMFFYLSEKKNRASYVIKINFLCVCENRARNSCFLCEKF